MKTLLLALVLALSGVASAADLCESAFQRPGKLSSVSPLLAEVPQLQIWFGALIRDPDIPANIRRVLEASLLKKDTTSIVRLTSELRKEMSIPWNLDAFVDAHSSSFRKVNHPIDDSSWDARLARTIRAFINRGPKKETTFSVYIQGVRFDDVHHDLVTLVHELAHVRFYSFFERNLKYFEARWPSWAIGRVGERFEVNADLFSFLTERYAFEIEYQVMKYGLSRGLMTKPMARYRDVKDAEFRTAISAMIIEHYEIRDQRVIALQNIPLSALLRWQVLDQQPE